MITASYSAIGRDIIVRVHLGNLTKQDKENLFRGLLEEFGILNAIVQNTILDILDEAVAQGRTQEKKL